MGEILVENLLSGFPLLFTNNKYIFDLHGDVVDELRMIKRINSLTRFLLYSVEFQLIRNAKEISVSSNNHKKLLEYKLGNKFKKISVVPNLLIHDFDNYDFEDLDFERFICGKIGIIYSGSALEWQNPLKMLEFIEKILSKFDNYRFIILTNQEIVFSQIIENNFSHLTDFIFIKSVKHSQINYYYKSCKFGLIFRDYSRTNFVACPTKLMEYAANNLSILYTGYLGDFLDLNYGNENLISCDNYNSEINEILIKMENCSETNCVDFLIPKRDL